MASQGPLDTTVGDFWRMVWQQRVTAVIMAANFLEMSKVLVKYLKSGLKKREIQLGLIPSTFH